MTNPRPYRYILFFKPYGVLCQFTDDAGRKTLKDFGPFPPRVYAVGRLDLDSEGLVLLTDDNELNHKLTDPKFKHPRSYLVQVEGIPLASDIARLKSGVMIKGKKTMPAEVRLLVDDPGLPPRNPSIRFRQSIPTSWLVVTLREGRNRQVRRMTASVGYPTLRLVRTAIGKLSLGLMQEGQSRELTEEEIRDLKEDTGARI